MLEKTEKDEALNKPTTSAGTAVDLPSVEVF